MFKLFNKNQHKFVNSKFYKISDVLLRYKAFKRNTDLTCDGIKLRHSKYLDLLLFYLENKKEFRCTICGCKANHFRLCQETGGNLVFHLFGIHHIKGTKDAEYLFFNKDHILPASHGGYSDKKNLRLTCEKCNTERQNKIESEDKEKINDIKGQQFKTKLIQYLGAARHNIAPGSKDRKFLKDLINKIKLASYNTLKSLID